MAIIIITIKILILHNFASPKQLIEINKTLTVSQIYQMITMKIVIKYYHITLRYNLH